MVEAMIKVLLKVTVKPVIERSGTTEHYSLKQQNYCKYHFQER